MLFNSHKDKAELFHFYAIFVQGIRPEAWFRMRKETYGVMILGRRGEHN